MTAYSTEEILRLIQDSTFPSSGGPEVGILLATRAQAAATLRVSEMLEEILIELQIRRN